ncbi:hypothetical protein RhiTH_010296 [Rhizoctonia solani]
MAIPSKSAKEIADYAVIHVGWPANKGQYMAQRRVHFASTNIILAFCANTKLYPLGPAIMLQTIAWPGNTEEHNASNNILRLLFKEKLSELSSDRKENTYLDWIQLHAPQGSQYISSWTPIHLMLCANHFILNSLAYKSPTSFAQLSNHQVLVSDLVPEVSLKFVTQLSLELAVGKGLIQIEIDNETHISNDSGALLTDQLSVEDKGNNKTVVTLLFSNWCHSPDAHTGNNANNPEATNFPVE